MDGQYQHASIQLYIMGLKPSVCTPYTTDKTSQGIDQQVDDVKARETEPEKEEGEGSGNPIDEASSEMVEEDGLQLTRLPDGKLSDWEARRYGSMAARLLRDIKIT